MPCCTLGLPTRAETVEGFYKGKTVTRVRGCGQG
jgi:hypothetical protein